MSNATRQINRKKKAKEEYEIKGEIHEDLYWDELISLYNVCKSSLTASSSVITKIGEDFKDVIDNDDEIRKAYSGLTNMVVKLVSEVMAVASVHSKDGVPYTGKVDSTDIEKLDLYTNVIIGYQTHNEKIVTSIENATLALMTMIEQANLKQEQGEEGGK